MLALSKKNNKQTGWLALYRRIDARIYAESRNVSLREQEPIEAADEVDFDTS